MKVVCKKPLTVRHVPFKSLIVSKNLSRSDFATLEWRVSLTSPFQYQFFSVL